jgi:hypothetical protein
MLHIDRKKDNRVIRAFTHTLADIPGGVTVSVADLAQKVLQEGTPIGKDAATGLYHVVKVAKLTAVATNTATSYVVAKGHNFKVGDFIALKEGGKAYAITAIADTNSETDTITVGTTLGVAAAAGDALYHATAESTAAAVLKYKPIALVGESYDVKDGSNLVVNAWTIAQIREANIPAIGPEVKAKLTGIQFI